VNQYNTSYIIFCVVLKSTVAGFNILGDG